MTKSGKAGGSVYAKNKAGYYVRSNRRGNAPTAAAAAVKAFLISVSQSWRQLIESDRQSWNVAAPNYPYVNRLGETRTRSGFQLFMLFNLENAINGWPQINVPPGGALPWPSFFIDENPAVSEFVLDISTPASSVFQIGTNILVTGQLSQIKLFATRILSVGRTAEVADYKALGIFDWADFDPAGATDMKAAYAAVFGTQPVPVVPGQVGVIFVKFVGVYPDTTFYSGYHQDLAFARILVDAVA